MLFVLDIFVECLRELIGAGSALKAATDAGKTLDGIVYVHADQKSGNALGIAGTSAVEGHLLDDLVFNVDFDCSGANALGAISDVFHDNICSFLLMRREHGINSDCRILRSCNGKIDQKCRKH